MAVHPDRRDHSSVRVVSTVTPQFPPSQKRSFLRILIGLPNPWKDMMICLVMPREDSVHAVSHEVSFLALVLFANRTDQTSRR
jgi:hypothetical protein